MSLAGLPRRDCPTSDLSKTGGKHNWSAIFFSVSKGLPKGEPCWNALKKESDLSQIDDMGRTLLHVAAEKGAEKIIRELVDAIDPATRDAEGLTPLMSCVKSGFASPDTMGFLAGVCDANAVSRSGKTALGLAAEGGMSNYVKTLLEKQPGLSAEQGSKAFDLALAGYQETEAKALAHAGPARKFEMQLLDHCLETLDFLAPFATEKQKETAWAALNEERHGLRRAQWESDAIHKSLKESLLGGRDDGSEAENGAENLDENGDGATKKAPKRRL